MGYLPKTRPIRSRPEIVRDHAGLSALRERYDALAVTDLDDARIDASRVEAELADFESMCQGWDIPNLCLAGFDLGDVLVHPSDPSVTAIVGRGDTVSLSRDGHSMGDMSLMEATGRLAARSGVSVLAWTRRIAIHAPATQLGLFG